MLPIAQVAKEFQKLLSQNQVVVVAGATGSGKTTQLPKYCLAAGRKRIVHTQPRRIAARSVAERIAQELDTEIGELVGYQIRFTKETSAQTNIKVVTDGILLAELGQDRLLRQYDTIIIDEAHERSLNIDFLLGYLKKLLVKRPELKLIITSATIDTARFAQHFNAPVMEIPGRSYPVEIRYHQIPDGVEPLSELPAAIKELWPLVDGDILVFFATEREIRDALELVNGMQLPNTEVLPLFGRLPLSAQNRVFEKHHKHRIILATNVAETSITVPGIAGVIDFCQARISRYSAKAKVQKLPVEYISKAEANQRSGRCGRIRPGVAIRMVSQTEFEQFVEYPTPEILRTNLASVMLHMAWAKLGDIQNFDFIDAPNAARISDGRKLLQELGAFNHNSRLTRVGKMMAQLPIEPRYARMLVEAQRRNCLRDLQAIVAGLSVVDIREIPDEEEDLAKESHDKFLQPLAEQEADDITALLQIWHYLKHLRKTLSHTAFRKRMRAEYLNYLRYREWLDLYGQIKDICRGLGFSSKSQEITADRLSDIRRSLASGWLSHVGLRQENLQKTCYLGPTQYLGPRGIKFAIQPGSALAKARPELVLVDELVETSRLWGRSAMRITAAELEDVGAHLLKRSYSEPHWNPRYGQAQAYAQITLLGVPIRQQVKISLASIDPQLAREFFLRHALTAGEWECCEKFWQHNQKILAELRELSKRSGIDLVDQEKLFEFYQNRIPKTVTSAPQFYKWWRKQKDKTLLFLKETDFQPQDLRSEFPDFWQVGDISLPLTYEYGELEKFVGITVNIPLMAMADISAKAFNWQVPGLRLELVRALLQNLPKAIRIKLIPLAKTAESLTQKISDGRYDPQKIEIWEALALEIATEFGVNIARQDWDLAKLPKHLILKYSIADSISENLGELKGIHQKDLASAVVEINQEYLKPVSQIWNFGDIPIATRSTPIGYLGLAKVKGGVALNVFPTETQAQRSHELGLFQLLADNLPNQDKQLVKELSAAEKLQFSLAPYPDVPSLLAEAKIQAISQLVAKAQARPEKIRSEAAFSQLRQNIAMKLYPTNFKVLRELSKILQYREEILQILPRLPSELQEDLSHQLENLCYCGFLATTPEKYYYSLARYLAGILHRAQQAPLNSSLDAKRMADVWELEDRFEELAKPYPVGALPAELLDFSWQLEELRISLFAQKLGVKGKISVTRLAKILDSFTG